MVQALKSEKQKVPEYLVYLQKDLNDAKKSAVLKGFKASNLKFLPMSFTQAEAVEKLLSAKEYVKKLLSPTQVKILEIINKSPEKAWPDVSGKGFLKAWNEFAIFFAKNK